MAFFPSEGPPGPAEVPLYSIVIGCSRVSNRDSVMPLKLGSSGACTGPQEGPQGQRDEGELLFPPSLSRSVMGSE